MEVFCIFESDIFFVLNKMRKDTSFAKEALGVLDYSVINRITRNEETTTGKFKSAYAEIERQLSCLNIADNHIDSFLRENVVLTARNHDELKATIKLVCNITNKEPFDIDEYRDDLIIYVTWLGKIEVLGGDLAQSLLESKFTIPCYRLLESATPLELNTFKITLSANLKKNSEAKEVSELFNDLASKDLSKLEFEHLQLLKQTLNKCLEAY